jgi:hypothetical protein
MVRPLGETIAVKLPVLIAPDEPQTGHKPAAVHRIRATVTDESSRSRRRVPLATTSEMALAAELDQSSAGRAPTHPL